MLATYHKFDKSMFTLPASHFGFAPKSRRDAKMPNPIYTVLAPIPHYYCHRHPMAYPLYLNLYSSKVQVS